MHRVYMILLLIWIAAVWAQEIDLSIHEQFWQVRQEIKESWQTEQIITSAQNWNYAIEEHYFPQIVDHFGTVQGLTDSRFNQYFLLMDTFYKSGGPVFLFVGGESALKTSDFYGLVLELAQKYNGLLLGLEHRFYGAEYGRSVPTGSINSMSLQLCTSKQAVEDLAYFVESFPALFPKYGLNRNTKWISVGGSYPGALSAWLRVKHPESIYASHASSAPLLAVENFWSFSYAVEEAFDYFSGNRACMNGWTRAIQVLDQKLMSIASDSSALLKFQNTFYDIPKSSVQYIADLPTVISYIIAPVAQYGPQFSWLALSDGSSIRTLDAVCDGRFLPAFTDPTATPDALLSALQTLFKTYTISVASGRNKRKRDVSSTYNFWMYQTCNEFGFQQVAQDLRNSSQLLRSYTAYSQFITVDYWRQVCFYQGNFHPPNTAETNEYFGGLDIKTPRILFVNGRYDPWHWLSVYGTPPNPNSQTSILYDGATHCNDMQGRGSVRTMYQLSVFDQISAVYDCWLLAICANVNSVATTATTSAASTQTTSVTLNSLTLFNSIYTTTMDSVVSGCYPAYILFSNYIAGAYVSFEGHNFRFTGANWAQISSCNSTLPLKCYDPIISVGSYGVGVQLSQFGRNYKLSDSGWIDEGACTMY